MTKAHLVDQIADSTELNKQECEKIVNSLFAAMTKALQAGERVDIRGFGTFKVNDKAARRAAILAQEKPSRCRRRKSRHSSRAKRSVIF